MNNIKCLECGNVISNRGAKKYCSRECCLKNTSIQSQKFDRSYKIGSIPWNKNLKGIHLNPKHEFKKGHSINLGRIRTDVGENSKCWKGRTIKECLVCQKEMLLPPWDKGRKFCGRICWALGTRGKGSPVFKGEKAVNRLRNRIAELPEYKKWHAIILKKYYYRCNKCKSRYDLQVHHNKKRFLDIIIDNNIKTTEDARNCKELWDTDNGEVLCRLHHRTTDTYGTKGTSKHLLT